MIVLWLLGLALIGLTVYAVGKLGVSVPRQHLQWLLIGYLTTLLVSPFALHLLPTERFAPIVDAATLSDARVANRELLQSALRGRPSSVTGVHRTREWRFPMSGLALTVIGAVPQLPVVIEHKTGRDGIVEVALYRTPSIQDMVDISRQIPLPVELSFSVNALTVVQPVARGAHFLRFSPDAPAQALLLALEPQGVLPSVSLRGAQVLYLRIPANVEIKDPDPSLLFVDREGP
ncbi:MAG: hypothetical protein DDT38_01346 [Firmicutes bacterium]|nr:hypothetical protein [candidate division NPL-UPA2 bacterium]